LTIVVYIITNYTHHVLIEEELSEVKFCNKTSTAVYRTCTLFLLMFSVFFECGVRCGAGAESRGETERRHQLSSLPKRYRSAPDYSATSDTSAPRKMAGSRPLMHMDMDILVDTFPADVP
jgi:hypothetical protein